MAGEDGAGGADGHVRDVNGPRKADVALAGNGPRPARLVADEAVRAPSLARVMRTARA